MTRLAADLAARHADAPVPTEATLAGASRRRAGDLPVRAAAAPPRRRLLGVALGTTALVACGGGGGNDEAAASGGTTTTASTDAALAGLRLSTGTLSPVFAADVTAYAVTVANSVSTVTVSPSTRDAGATVRVNGTVVASGASSAAIALVVGSNTLKVVVTAADGTTQRAYDIVATRSGAGACTLTATETEGPYPLLAMLSNSALVRRDIRESKTGVPLTLNLTLLDASAGCTPVAGAAVYVWHCDKDGLYSGYSTMNNLGQAGQVYLRGIQVTDAQGAVTFTTIYPGWYAGRITHIHLQVYLQNNLTVTATATTQLAFPTATTQAVYASALYTKGQNTSVASFSADNVFSDGTDTELVTISGNVTNGYTASLTITIA